MLKSRFVFAAAMAACACALHAGRTIEADYTLEADEDWSSEGTVTINADVVVNLNGHDLRVGGLAGEGRIVSSTANLVANGSFEVFNAAISGSQKSTAETANTGIASPQGNCASMARREAAAIISIATGFSTTAPIPTKIVPMAWMTPIRAMRILPAIRNRMLSLSA